MILIISENKDRFTDKVIEWLQFYGIYDIFRINEDDKVHVNKIEIHNSALILRINDRLIDLADVELFWYRRGNLNHPFRKLIESYPPDINQQVHSFLYHEWTMCRNYIVYMLEQKKSIGNYFRAEANKLINLKIAQESGLDIPQTIISDNPSVIEDFGSQLPSITKPIGEAMAVMENSGYHSLLTKQVEPTHDINKEQEYIFPSLLQENIEKEIEIRSFVLFDKIYSMAILSQRNEKTETDFRNYDWDRMNRTIPYKLPEYIEERIFTFMRKAQLNTGSIDLIKTKNGHYIFLEVNPAGNIKMVDDNCNYHIGKHLAEIIKREISN